MGFTGCCRWLVVLFLCLSYTGLYGSFQINWEFWYLDSLSAGLLLMAGALLVRQPLVAVTLLTSTRLIKEIGDLKTVCLVLLLYSCSFMALSFTRTALLVIVIDTCQATALSLNYCAFAVHFNKAVSKKNSSMIFGK